MLLILPANFLINRVTFYLLNYYLRESKPPAIVTQTLLASGERVLLQTAIVPIQNSVGNNEIKARVLLDSASQRTFMTNKLAQRLKLPSEHKEYLSVSTFGARKATNIETCCQF